MDDKDARFLTLVAYHHCKNAYQDGMGNFCLLGAHSEVYAGEFYSQDSAVALEAIINKLYPDVRQRATDAKYVDMVPYFNDIYSSEAQRMHVAEYYVNSRHVDHP